ncbi:MAG: division/cell wall cluster transcriptional repressor MraZ [Patescibacteria group bacterium]|jgi:MraZ protein
MFIGEHNHNIDDKGRLQIPARFRGAFADGAVVTRGLDGCLFIYTLTEWQKLAEKLDELPLTGKDARQFSRLMLAGAVDVELDKQGRVILPGYLRQFAGIKSNVVVAGLMNRLEVWDEAKWKTEQSSLDQNSDEIAEKLMDFGI